MFLRVFERLQNLITSGQFIIFIGVIVSLNHCTSKPSKAQFGDSSLKSIYLFHLALALAFSYLLLTGCNKYEEVRENLKFLHPDYIKCDVVQVIDGDTFHCQLSNREIEKVRLIGVGILGSIEDGATDFSRSYLRRGTPVRLELDEQTRDSYGRIFAYVYLPGGKMLNALLIQEGYAQVIINPPNVKYKDLFLKLETEAREQGKGLWKSE